MLTVTYNIKFTGKRLHAIGKSYGFSVDRVIEVDEPAAMPEIGEEFSFYGSDYFDKRFPELWEAIVADIYRSFDHVQNGIVKVLEIAE